MRLSPPVRGEWFRKNVLRKVALILTGSAFLLLNVYSVVVIRDYLHMRHVTESSLEDPNFLSIHCNKGRLGNQMGTYATLLGLANLNKRAPYARDCNMKFLTTYFKVTATWIRDVDFPQRYHYELGSYLREQDKSIPSDKLFLSGYLYPLSFTFFHHIRDKIREEFTFKDHIINYVETYLARLRRTYSDADIIVGIHVRRTDYESWLKYKSRRGREVDMEYFKKAIKYFEDKYGKVLFVVVSDDRDWCQKNFVWSNTIVAPPAPDPAHDMALMSRCNHNIFSYGSFGFWGAYLSRGEVVYFADFLPPNSEYLLKEMPYNVTYLPDWIGIPTTPPGYWNESVPSS